MMSLIENDNGSNIYFEISIPHTVNPNSPYYQQNELGNVSGCGDVIRLPLFQREVLRHIQTVEDIEKKLERASERRNTILQEVKERNESIVSKAMALSKQKSERQNQAAAALKSKMEMNFAIKKLRRQQIIDEKIETAKRKLDKVTEIKSMKRSEDFDCQNCDHQDKENTNSNRKFQKPKSGNVVEERISTV